MYQSNENEAIMSDSEATEHQTQQGIHDAGQTGFMLPGRPRQGLSTGASTAKDVEAGESLINMSRGLEHSQPQAPPSQAPSQPRQGVSQALEAALQPQAATSARLGAASQPLGSQSYQAPAGRSE